MTMLKMLNNRSRLAFPLLFVIASLTPICDLSAQSYWDAIFELGYDPITQKVNHTLACRRIEDIHRLRQLISDSLTADEDLLIKIRDLDARITSLDVANIYDFLPYSDADSRWRAIGVRGQSDFNAYRLNEIDPHIEEWLNSSTADDTKIAGSQDHFGDIGLGIFIKPVRKDTFKFFTEARLYLDDIPAANVTRAINGMLTTTWSYAADAANRSTDSTEENTIGRQNERILNGISNDFPDLFRIILQYCDIEKIISSNNKNTKDSFQD